MILWAFIKDQSWPDQDEIRAHTRNKEKKRLKITLRAISDLLNVLRLGMGREKTHQHTAREKELRTSQIVA